MGRNPRCSKVGLNRGAWTAGEDKILTDYIKLHDQGNWRNLPLRAGLNRCGKSCRLRWLNYLRPDIKRGNITNDEEELIVRLHRLLGNRWSLIAGRLPERTDNEIKNYWNTKLREKEHARHNSTSSPKHGNQFDEESMKKTCDIEPQHKDGSRVVKPKAMRCTKTYFGPQYPHKTKPIDSRTMPEQSGLNKSSFSTNPIELCPSYGILEENNPSNFTFDADMGGSFLSDLLNSDFSSSIDTNHCNNNIINLSHFSDGSLLFYDEMLEDWNVSDDYDQSNIAAHNDHYLASMPECGKDLLA